MLYNIMKIFNAAIYTFEIRGLSPRIVALYVVGEFLTGLSIAV